MVKLRVRVWVSTFDFNFIVNHPCNCLSFAVYSGYPTMPGSSLWLVPPEDSELYKTIHNLILREVPALFSDVSPPQFTPHITLTADTVSDQEDPQAWLDGITLPYSVKDLQINIEQLHAGSIFFQSLIVLCEESISLCELAVHCRAAGVQDTDLQVAKRWAQQSYVPHCSLM